MLINYLTKSNIYHYYRFFASILRVFYLKALSASSAIKRSNATDKDLHGRVN